MRFSAASLLLAAAPAALAQDLTSLLQALNSSGHSRLVSIATQLESTDAGKSVISQLSSGSPFVLFAPTDSAFDSAPSNITSNPNLLADVVAYHIVQGNFTNTDTHYTNTTLGRTLLSDPTYVQLEGNKSQVVAWSIRDDNKTHVLNQRNDSTVTNTTTAGNITIYTIDHVLNFPESLSSTIPADNISLTGVETALRSVQLSTFNSTTNQTSTSSLFDVLNTELHGFTFFAPNTSAIQDATSALSGLQSNTTALQALFQNHIINGTTVYSPLLSGQNYTSAAGEPLQFTLNGTGHYVTSGNVTAQIIQPDVLLPNGVIHVIDRVLVNTQTDTGAASSAASSASSAATQSTSATAPIGFSATATLAGPSGSTQSSGSGSHTGNAAPGSMHTMPSVAQVVSVGMAVLGVVAGGAFVLA
ncbi:FAS1 domain-containing protein [Cubamyces sp. BRFM 1775]|nr:FAS1 domain-containing protein [Cubamyces sp. BRFM 1775]